MTQTSRLAILISGAGYGNFGDDLILRRWLSFYAGWDVVLVCGANIDSLVDGHKARRIQLHSLDQTSISQIEGIRENYRKACIHLTGGGFCNDKFGSAANVFALIKRLSARALVIGTGVSFYPLFADSRESLNWIRFDHISFRDRYSQDVYMGRNAFLTADDLIDAFEPARTGPERPRDLYINIQNQFDILENMSKLAQKLTKIIGSGEYERVIVAELCAGDLDILEYIGGERVVVVTRQEVMNGQLKISPKDNFTATRFHFRMLAEYADSTGIAIIADDYYQNKHETGVDNVNFLRNRTRVRSVQSFIAEETLMPRKEFAMNWRRDLKCVERARLRTMLNAC